MRSRVFLNILAWDEILCDISNGASIWEMWHVWNTETYLILASTLASFYLPSWWFTTLSQLPQWRKMFIYLWQKWHIESCHVRSVIIFCLWSRELLHNREMFQPSSPAPGDGCKIDSTTYLLRPFLAKTSQLILFYDDLKVWGWMADRQRGAGPSSFKMKVPTDFQVPRRRASEPRLEHTGRRQERGAVGI